MRVFDILPDEGLVVALVQSGEKIRAKPETGPRLLAPRGLIWNFVPTPQKLPQLVAAPAILA